MKTFLHGRWYDCETIDFEDIWLNPPLLAD